MESFSLNDFDRAQTKRLVALVRELSTSGHNPATSGNYSLRSGTFPGSCLVSESGVDKSQFAETNLLPIDYRTGKPHPALQGSGRRSSAETAIHLSVYRATSAGCVLHSHLLEALLFADLFPGQPSIVVEGLEILKGLKGVQSHETRVMIPCFPNTQDIDRLATELEGILTGSPLLHGFLLRHHGMYVWGESVEEAKRHLDVFEYVFRYYLSARRGA